MSEIEGLSKVLAALQGQAKRAQEASAARVEVGYSASYSAVIHEDLERKHPNGQAKFLEQPMRLLTGEMGKIIAGAVKAGKTLVEAELEAGQVLLAASQALVPVQTGALKASGYVKVAEE